MPSTPTARDALAMRVRFYLQTTPCPPGHPLPTLLADVLAYLERAEVEEVDA